MVSQLSSGNATLDLVSLLIFDVAMICVIIAVIRRRI